MAIFSEPIMGFFNMFALMMILCKVRLCQRKVQPWQPWHCFENSLEKPSPSQRPDLNAVGRTAFATPGLLDWFNQILLGFSSSYVYKIPWSKDCCTQISLLDSGANNCHSIKNLRLHYNSRFYPIFYVLLWKPLNV